MCITFLFTCDGDSLKNYKLILINNRDEFYTRKTLKANVKIDENLIQIYGTDIDTEIHGTWLAISKRNDMIKIGNLLNLPGEKVIVRKDELKGRGPIALDFVQSKSSIEEHNKKLCEVCTHYNSFNFLSVEITSEYIKTLFTNNATKSYVELEKGIIGISNSPMNSPLRKVVAGKKKFEKIIHDHEDKNNKELLVEQLMNLLKCDERYYPDDELIKRRGNDAELFSSIHVKGHQLYGSRTRTIILIDKFNNIDYIEETIINYDPDDPIWKRTRFMVEDNSVIECS